MKFAEFSSEKHFSNRFHLIVLSVWRSEGGNADLFCYFLILWISLSKSLVIFLPRLKLEGFCVILYLLKGGIHLTKAPGGTEIKLLLTEAHADVPSVLNRESTILPWLSRGPLWLRVCSVYEHCQPSGAFREARKKGMKYNNDPSYPVSWWGRNKPEPRPSGKK